MTQEQKERLEGWFLNLLRTYHIDFYRGLVLSDTVKFFTDGDPDRIETAIKNCRKISDLNLSPSLKDYPELLRELSQIEKKVPLSDAAYQAITHVFGGYWEEAIEALDKLRREHNEQNKHLNKKNMKYIVRNRLTDAICGEFDTKGQAGKWVEEYTHEQNKGLSPDAPEYCSPFDFLLLTK